jgi:chromosome segregation ATPase
MFLLKSLSSGFQRLRIENRLLHQRIDKLETVMSQQEAEGSCPNGNASDLVQSSADCTPSVAIQPVADTRPPATQTNDADDEMQRLQDELVACKLREAEANLSMKEFEQRLNQLERHWQHFLCESRSDTDGKSPSQPDLKETVMGLRLRETHLVAGMNDLKQSLMELETQNHIYERQIKRQQVEHTTLLEALSAAEVRENELLNTITQLERKISNLESMCQEEAAMSRLRDAECSQTVEEMRRRIAELEIENQELLTSARLQNRGDGVTYPDNGLLEQQYDETAGLKMMPGMFDAMADVPDNDDDDIVISPDRLARDLASDIDTFDLPIPSSLLHSDDFIMTSSFVEHLTSDGDSSVLEDSGQDHKTDIGS